MAETIEITVDERGVARLTLNRPDKHNAMNAAMIAELTEAAGRLGRDPAVRVVVLTGAGASFSAGGDLGWMRAQMEADAATRAREARRLAEMLGALDAMPKPLIGRVQGQAFGGGVGLISVCDVAIGVESAKLGLTEVRLGLIPATIGPYVIARMGAARARAVFFSGRVFGGGGGRGAGSSGAVCSGKGAGRRDGGGGRAIPRRRSGRGGGGQAAGGGTVGARR
jgi:methylglutaconyl-CoA hydratase